MAQKVKVELNSAGVRSLLKSKEMQALLTEKCANIAGNSGGDYEIYVAGTRAVGEVHSEGSKSGDKKLLRALKT